MSLGRDDIVNRRTIPNPPIQLIYYEDEDDDVIMYN